MKNINAKISALEKILGFATLICEGHEEGKLSEYLLDDLMDGGIKAEEQARSIQAEVVRESEIIKRKLYKLICKRNAIQFKEAT